LAGGCRRRLLRLLCRWICGSKLALSKCVPAILREHIAKFSVYAPQESPNTSGVPPPGFPPRGYALLCRRFVQAQTRPAISHLQALPAGDRPPQALSRDSLKESSNASGTPSPRYAFQPSCSGSLSYKVRPAFLQPAPFSMTALLRNALAVQEKVEEQQHHLDVFSK